MLWLLALVACGAVKQTADTAVASDSAARASDALSHGEHIQPIWDGQCGPCHLEGNSGATLELVDGYRFLVGVPSTQAPTMMRVQPGEAASSYLWMKLTDAHTSVGGSGDPMPPSGARLADEELNKIRAWIEEGAAR